MIVLVHVRVEFDATAILIIFATSKFIDVIGERTTAFVVFVTVAVVAVDYVGVGHERSPFEV